MELMRDFLTTNCACTEGVEWFDAQSESDVVKVLRKLDKENHTDWANWLIVHKMTKKQCISYAIFSAEQVIDIYEKKYPDDNHPRQAIDAAKKYLDHPSKENAAAAGAGATAASAAYRSAYSECAATSEAYRSTYYLAAYSAAAAAHTAAAAYSAAAHVATYTADATDAAVDAATHAGAAYGKEKMQRKILNYGIKLID